jgi:hypothetical protein
MARDLENQKRLKKEWYERNKELTKERARLWHANNPDKVSEKNTRYKSKNREKINEANRAWWAENKDKRAAYGAKRRSAKLQRTPQWLTEDQLWMMQQAYELAALRTKMLGFDWHVDHIIPLQGKLVCGLHVPWNLQVIPGIDNIKKSNKWAE